MRRVTRVCDREDWTHVRYLHYVRLLRRRKVSTFALSAAFPPDWACARIKISLTENSPSALHQSPGLQKKKKKNTGGGQLFIIYRSIPIIHRADTHTHTHTHTQSMSLSLSLRVIGTVTSDLSDSVKMIRSPNHHTHTHTHTHTHKDSMIAYSLWHLLSPSTTLSADPIHYEATRTNYTFPREDM